MNKDPEPQDQNRASLTISSKTPSRTSEIPSSLRGKLDHEQEDYDFFENQNLQNSTKKAKTRKSINSRSEEKVNIPKAEGNNYTPELQKTPKGGFKTINDYIK
jgi:hypothetical protein